MIYRIGTRRSSLAKVQTHLVAEKLKALGLSCKIIEIQSEGDADRSQPLYEVESESPGLFTKQLELALTSQTIDLAVHSLKDLPTVPAEGLKVAAVLEREVAVDCLVISERAFTGGAIPLKQGAMVGTSSLRREAELLSLRPDLRVVPIRGNVPTRVRIVEEGRCDAVILAKAGVRRLGLSFDKLRCVDLDEVQFVPAPGQGAIAVETRTDIPQELEKALLTFHCVQTETETRIERKVLQELHGGCTLPLGVRCHVVGKTMNLKSFLGISKDRLEHKHVWLSFERFDISSPSENTLVADTVAYLKGKIS